MTLLEATWDELLTSFVLTWAIGLTPPLLIRYLFAKRPLSKWSAIGIVGVFWIVEFGCAQILDEINGIRGPRQHTALMLIAFVSYYILVRQNKVQIESNKAFP